MMSGALAAMNGTTRPKRSLQAGELCPSCKMFVTWVGPRQTQKRGWPPQRWKTSRKILHVNGEYRAWHWEDQVGRNLRHE